MTTHCSTGGRLCRCRQRLRENGQSGAPIRKPFAPYKIVGLKLAQPGEICDLSVGERTMLLAVVGEVPLVFSGFHGLMNPPASASPCGDCQPVRGYHESGSLG